MTSLVTRQDAHPAKFTAQDCQCLGRDTVECRKRLEDNDNRHIRGDPSQSSSCETSGSYGKREGGGTLVRFSDLERLDSDPEGVTETQTSGQEAPVKRKRSAEINAERVEEGAAETATTDFDKRTALKRKAEGDPSDSEVEDSAMNSLAELWHKEEDPGSTSTRETKTNGYSTNVKQIDSTA